MTPLKNRVFCRLGLMTAIFIAATALCALSARAVDKKTLDETIPRKIVLVADEWCPYNCEAGSDKPGFMVEIATAAFARHNIIVEYISLPWTRAIESVREGKYSGIIGAYYGDAEDFIYPTIPQGRATNVFYTRANDNWQFHEEKDLALRSLGVIADYSYSKFLDEYIEAHKGDMRRIQVISGDDAMTVNINKLIAGRVDTIIEDKQVVDYHLSQEGETPKQEKIREAGILPVPEDENGIIFIAFSPALPEAQAYADILTKETENMRKSGALKKILDRYGVEDFKD